MTAADLIALGAPELPAGHFYRIGDTMTGYAVQIRRERWWGSSRVSLASVDRYTDPATGKSYPEPVSLTYAIGIAAQRAYDHRASMIERDRWRGDHR